MLIFHQAGHNTIWNLDSFQNGIGDGIIISPVHYDIDNVNGLKNEIKKKSYFDPQFYVPDSQKKKLNTYHFFPEQMTDGFSTSDFVAVAYEAAQQCIEFQIENGFKGLFVPARYHGEMITDFIEKQRAFSVEPFLSFIQKNRITKEVFITLPLTAAMIGDRAYREQLLNWATSYPEITGVYLLINFNEPLKQICDIKKLTDYLDFIYELTEADLKVICGYCNTEALLCAISAPFAVTIGAYENTRRFSIDKFLDDESEVRGPAPRIYFPKLLNWIRFDITEEIKNDFPVLWERIYTPTDWSESVFTRAVRPHFTQADLYHHHFQLIHGQLREIASKKSVADRAKLVQGWVVEANELYGQLQQNGVLFFDNNCKGEHLPIWNRIIRKAMQQK
jgi:hypothetical protein